jgi:sugar/nucleoside kinase (ribokinase family)
MDARIDLLAIGNAIVDVIAPADEALVAEAGLVKGSMRLICADEALALTRRMAGAQELSGGSAANTAVGLAALGGRAAFLGKAGRDPLGDLFRADLAAAGVEDRCVLDPDGVPTARCLVLVSADGQRSMCTFPGAAHRLSPDDIDEAAVAEAAILFLEGYLWDSPSARAALEHAIGIARAAGQQVALTPSDIACIARCGAAMGALIAEGAVDQLFVNDAELAALGDASGVTDKVGLVVVTHGAEGATAFSRGRMAWAPAAHAPKVVDTTGAGDAFAAGFLRGHCQGLALEDSLALGAKLAAQVIGRFGARPPAR